MTNITVDFSSSQGKVKPMHAVNNGPAHKFGADQRVSNLEAFREAGIPYARNHDASFFATYGGEHTVDVIAIFPDFDADPYEPASYDFAITDEYIRVTELAGVRTFYRLGNRIEHEIKKYGTLPPKDFHKWAVICEHIIRHYTEGWADGFRYDMPYWEIWNEADLDVDDSDNKRCWGGTKAEFFEFFNIALAHLKGCFPHLRIGGPALAWRLEWADELLAQLTTRPDFFSWHIYTNDPKKVSERIEAVHQLLEKHGLGDVESILNEWNYVKGWEGDEVLYTRKTIKGLKGSAFTAAVMTEGQREDVDMLMYYDARPSVWNGLFSTDYISEKLKGYYPFVMFNTLYKLGESVMSQSDHEDVYVTAATGEGEAAVMFTHFSDDDTKTAETVSLDFTGYAGDAAEAEVFVLDEDRDLESVGKIRFRGGEFGLELVVPNFTSYLIRIKNI